MVILQLNGKLLHLYRFSVKICRLFDKNYLTAKNKANVIKTFAHYPQSFPQKTGVLSHMTSRNPT